jgi:hypothetical protein
MRTWRAVSPQCRALTREPTKLAAQRVDQTGPRWAPLSGKSRGKDPGPGFQKLGSKAAIAIRLRRVKCID